MHTSESERPKVSPRDLSFHKLSVGCPVADFQCGYGVIDDFLQSKAQLWHSHFYSCVTTAHYEADPRPVRYYTILVDKERQSEFEGQPFIDGKMYDDKKLTTLHLKFFGVKSQFQRKGIGAIMMGRVIYESYEVIRRVGCAALTLQFMDYKSEALYRSVGFKDYGTSGHNRLYLASETIVSVVEDAEKGGDDQQLSDK